MSLIDRRSQDAEERQFSAAQIAKSGPVAACVGADGRCTVIVGGRHAAPNSTLKISPYHDMKGPPLAAYLSGTTGANGKRIEPTAAGDVVVFSRAYADGGALVVDRPATRMHDGMDGHVQFMYALARPSRTTVSKRGVSQWMTVADPSTARFLAKPEDLAAFAEDAFARKWPGGTPGILLRHRKHEVYQDVYADESEPLKTFVARVLGTFPDLFDNGAFEAVPQWSLPMGREQAMREHLPPDADAKGASGDFTKLYPTSSREIAFVPTALILGDEVEWAFGAPVKGERKRRVVLGAQPIHPKLGVTRASMATSLTGGPSAKPWGAKTLFSADEMARAAAGRLSRRPSAPANATPPRGGGAFGDRPAPPPQAERPAAAPAPSAPARRMGRPGVAPAAPRPAVATPQPTPVVPSPPDAQTIAAVRPAPDAPPPRRILGRPTLPRPAPRVAEEAADPSSGPPTGP